ncbi:hypothetical protein SAMN00808754_1457 [Thermanaeromonas toyohensis ToBE]|uniref:Uncharacterized protein n=2 Tax=Thermanaeromonas TaxID=202949 RepID=A0A1W1VSJ5_9FIRM|nr:hypothetical protein SAMN00808754_1457 [Thermanaeromonas toyohensis ToBE]
MKKLFFVSLAVYLLALIAAYVTGYSGRLYNWVLLTAIILAYYFNRARKQRESIDFSAVIRASIFVWAILFGVASIISVFVRDGYIFVNGLWLATTIYGMLCVGRLRREMNRAAYRGNR